MKTYFIFRQDKKSFSKKNVLKTIQYITRDANSKELYSSSPNYDESKLNDNVFLPNFRGERKSDLEFKGATPYLIKKEMKEYIKNICDEMGIEAPDFIASINDNKKNNKDNEEKSKEDNKEDNKENNKKDKKNTNKNIVFKENLFTTSSDWQRQLFISIKDYVEDYNEKNGTNYDYHQACRMALNFCLAEYQDSHDNLFEYKDSLTICSIIHWDKVDIDEMIASEESHGAVHIHQIQLPIVRVGSQTKDLSFEEAFRKTVEKEEKLKQLRKENDNRRKRLNDDPEYKGPENKEKRKTKLAEYHTAFKAAKAELESLYGSYILEKDDNGNPTGNLLLNNRQIIKHCEEHLIYSSSRQERININYERTPDGLYDLDRPLEATEFGDPKQSNRLYLNYIQDRLFVEMQERGKDRAELQPDGTYLFRGKPIDKFDAGLVNLLHDRYKELERGERNMNPDGTYKRASRHIKNKIFRADALAEQAARLAEEAEAKTMMLENEMSETVSAYLEEKENIERDRANNQLALQSEKQALKQAEADRNQALLQYKATANKIAEAIKKAEEAKKEAEKQADEAEKAAEKKVAAEKEAERKQAEAERKAAEIVEKKTAEISKLDKIIENKKHNITVISSMEVPYVRPGRKDIKDIINEDGTHNLSEGEKKKIINALEKTDMFGNVKISKETLEILVDIINNKNKDICNLQTSNEQNKKLVSSPERSIEYRISAAQNNDIIKTINEIPGLKDEVSLLCKKRQSEFNKQLEEQDKRNKEGFEKSLLNPKSNSYERDK